MKRLYRLAVYLLAITATHTINSCSTEPEIDTPQVYSGDTAEISFIAGMPSVTQVATRASESENAIEDIYVLVFEKGSGNLISKSKGKNLQVASDAQNNNKVTFKATLPVGQLYTFMILANTGTALSGIEVGTSPASTRSDVEAVVVSHTNEWNNRSEVIPMWGEKDLTLSASDTPSFELTRMLARINVEIDLGNDFQGNPRDNFKLTSVRYYNYNTAGALVPGSGKYDSDLKRAIAPTIPSQPGTKTGECLTYSGSAIKNEASCSDVIYVFEAQHNGSTYNTPTGNSDWIDNPCLVIGGQYKADDGTWLEESFYRVDFISKQTDPQGNVTDKWLSVLRNFSYNVTITQVSGSGFPDEETALNSAPINMESNILEWNEKEMGEIVFDGTFYLSVSRDEFTAERGAVTDKKDEYILHVKTDYIYQNNPNHTKSGWHVEKYVDAEDETKAVTWLKLVPENGEPNDRVEAYFTFEENPDYDNRSAIVWIAAGRLRYPVKVTQRVLSLYITDPDNNDNEVSLMEFVVPIPGATHSPRKFDITWTPTSSDVSIEAVSTQVWNPFQPDWLTPNPANQSWIIPSNSPGTQRFEIDAPTVDQSAIDQDPFYQKETTYYFKVDNGADSETKGITLHQIYYNIVVDTYTYYLNGSTQTLTVRSNTEWVITDIEEWLYNRDPAIENPSAPVMLRLNNYDNLKIGTTGGPNTSGEAIGFTVVNNKEEAHTNKWGTVFVTFESPTEKFPPKRVALSFPPNTLTLLGLGYTLDVRGHNVAFPVSYHRNSAHRLLSSSVNFGSTPESTVKVNDFRIIAQNISGAFTAAGKTDNSNWYSGAFADYLNDFNPDIVVISYGFQTLYDTEAAELATLRKYLDNGGVVIFLYAASSATNLARAFNVLLDDTFTTTGNDRDIYRWSGASAPDTGGVHPTVSGDEWKDDPILDGPFGDMRGKAWGSYYYFAGIRAEKIKDWAYIYSYSDDRYTASATGNRLPGGYATSFRHKTKNLFWVGNSGFVASYYNHINETDPFKLKDDFTPDVRENFGYLSGNAAFPKTQQVYNSYIFANAIAWAISVSNHKPPVGGY